MLHHYIEFVNWGLDLKHLKNLNKISQVYTADQNKKRDLAAFFAHAVQETGENNADLYA